MKLGLLAALLLLIGSTLATAQTERSQVVPAEVTLDHSVQIEVASRIVGDTFVAKIYLPDSYFESTSSTYPVIYLTDGDRYFGLASDLVYAELSRNDIDVVLVGVAYGTRHLNDEKRDRDFRAQGGREDTGGATRFRDFLRRELIPRLEKQYRLDPRHRTLAGWSRGGTFTLMTMFQNPTLFRNYVSLAPRLNYENWSVIKAEAEYARNHKSLPSRLYLAMGEEDERIEHLPGLVSHLQKRNYEGFELEAETIADVGHDLSALFQGLRNGLQHFFHLPNIAEAMGGWIENEGIEAAAAKYRALRGTAAEDYDFREARLNELGYQFLFEGQVSLAVAIFELNVETYPDSFNVYDSLGEALLESGEIQEARASYQRSLTLNPGNENARAVLEQIKDRR